MSIEFNGKTIETDDEGYLLNQSDWSRELAVFMAQRDEVELTPAHWELIDLIREYYVKYGTTPNIRMFTKVVAKRLGPDKGNSRYLYGLFEPQSIAPTRLVALYAGLPMAIGDI